MRTTHKGQENSLQRSIPSLVPGTLQRSCSAQFPKISGHVSARPLPPSPRTHPACLTLRHLHTQPARLPLQGLAGNQEARAGGRMARWPSKPHPCCTSGPGGIFLHGSTRMHSRPPEGELGSWSGNRYLPTWMEPLSLPLASQAPRPTLPALVWRHGAVRASPLESPPEQTLANTADGPIWPNG